MLIYFSHTDYVFCQFSHRLGYDSGINQGIISHARCTITDVSIICLCHFRLIILWYLYLGNDHIL